MLMLFSDTGLIKNASLSRPHPRIRRFATSMLLAVCLGAVIWLERVALLQGAAELWIVSDAATPSDVAVVLGGGLDVRPFAAADLYKRGLVKRVLISQVGDDRLVSIGATLNHTEANRLVLLKLGVPDEVIERFGTESKNTRDEAIALSEWSIRNHAASFIIPTEIFSARRVRFIFHRVLKGETSHIEVLSLDPPLYTRADWWKTDTGLIAFQNEVVKYVYYRLKY